MKSWQRQSINKSLANYEKTKDIEHLMDVIRVYEYSKISRVAARLTKKIYKLIIPRRKERINEDY